MTALPQHQAPSDGARPGPLLALYLRVARRLRHASARARGRTAYALVPGTIGGETVPMGALISPLRYDILIRMHFFACYAERRDQFARAFDTFLEEPPVRDYAVWFRECRIRRALPEAYWLRGHVRRMFREQVRRAAALYDALEAQGFRADAQPPIELYDGDSVCSRRLPALATRYFAGDGCHRLAFLALRDVVELAPDTYVVRRFRRLQPIDATAALTRCLPLGEESYVRFLTSGYAPGQAFSRLADLLTFMQRSGDSRLGEARAIARIHGFHA